MVIRNGGSKISTSPPYLVKNERSLREPYEYFTSFITISQLTLNSMLKFKTILIKKITTISESSVP